MLAWAEINGSSLRHEVIGDGAKTLVLIHEMGGTLESWDWVLSALRDSRRILRYDWRGHGLSSKLRGQADIDDMVQDLEGLLDFLGFHAPVALMGAAVGGAIAMRFAALRPARTAALIGLAPATGIAPERRGLTLARADRAERDGMEEATDALLGAGWPEQLRADKTRFCQYRAKWLDNDHHSFAAVNRMLAGLDMDESFAAIACPTLIIAGSHDGLRPPAMLRDVANKIRGAQFFELPAGHFMAVQAPDLVAAQVEQFLRAANF